MSDPTQSDQPRSKSQKRRDRRRVNRDGGGSGQGAPIRNNFAASLTAPPVTATQPAATQPVGGPPPNAQPTAPSPQKVKQRPVLSFTLPAEIVVGDTLSLKDIAAETKPATTLRLIQNGTPVPQLSFTAGGQQGFQITWDATDDLLAGPGPNGDVTVDVQLPLRPIACPPTFQCTYGDKLDLARLNVSALPSNAAPPTSNLPADGILPAGTFNAVFTAPAVTGLWRQNTGKTTITVAPAARRIEYKLPAAPLVIGDSLSAETTFAAKATAGPDKPALAVPSSGKADTAGDAVRITLKLPDNPNYQDATESFTIVVAKRPRQIICNKTQAARLVWGDPLTPDIFDARASAGPDQPIITMPANGVTTGPNNAQQIVLTFPPSSEWADATEAFTVEIGRRPRNIICNKTPAAPLVWGDPITVATFAASTSTGPDQPVLVTPAGGVTTAPDKAQKIVLSLPANPNYDDAPAEEFTIAIEKRTPTLTWNAAPATLNTGAALPPALCNATINPGTLAGKIEYDPPAGKPVRKAGQQLMSAIFPGDNLYRAAGPATNRLVVGNASQIAGATALSAGNIAANWVDRPATGGYGAKMTAWNSDTGGIKTQARTIMAAIKNMTRAQTIDYLNALPHVAIDTEAMLWKLGNGLQVRIKMKGDEYISGAVVIMEAVTSAGFSYDQGTVAFKVTVEGEAAPKGPQQLAAATGNRIDATDYKNGAMGMNHILIMPKPPQAIEWDLADNTTVLRDDPSIVQTVLTAQAAGTVTYHVGRQQITERFMIPGDGQILEARAAATTDLDTNKAQRRINVSARTPAAETGRRR
jgi:hypothetical protein